MTISIIFHTSQIDVRGTCNSLFYYAHYNEVLLGNRSAILTLESNPKHDDIALDRFKERFKVFTYTSRESRKEIHNIVKDFDIFYDIRYGLKDEFVFSGVKNCIHAVFDMIQPHGDVFAGVSETLALKFGQKLFVPHMIGLEPDNKTDNLREELGIPESATVFGRYGGMDTFDLQIAYEAIREIVRSTDNIYFIFINTYVFDTHPRVIFLPKIIKDEDKNKFIRTCDACIHAQSLGETFGIALGEFSVNNKPIITYGGPTWNNAHKDILRDKALLYYGKDDLVQILLTFDRHAYSTRDNNAYKEYTPEKVMKQFEDIFING